MQYRYRVVGKVTQPFILRGAYFIIGSTIEFYITESELAFVKERCELEKVEDLQKATKTTNSVSKSKGTQKAVENGQSKRTSKKVDTDETPRTE